MTQPTITLTMVPAGAELIVKALRAITPLPDANIDAFVAELWNQYQTQARAALEAAQAAAATQAQDEPAEAALAPSDMAAGGTD